MTRPKYPKPFKRKDTGKWCISYFDPEKGRRVRETVGTKEEVALKRAGQVYNEMMAIFLGEPDAGREDISLETLVDEFFLSKEGRTEAITIKSYRAKATYLKKFIETKFPSIKTIRQIKPVYLEEFLNSRREEGKKHRTVEADRQVVKAIFNFADEQGYLTQSPARSIKPYKNMDQAKHPPYWTKDEVQKILAEIKPGWRDAHELLYHTGLRKAELMFLTWNDVTLDGEDSFIRIQAKKGWRPKNNKVRDVPLNDRAQEIIKRQTKLESNDYVFHGPRGGKQLHRDKFYRELKRALDVVGLEGNVHQWRHTFASHLVDAGIGIETVSDLLGHSTLEMTMIYVYLAQNRLKKAVDVLDSPRTN